jgi:O-antigen/teichoic acid export membrane protein
VSANYGTFYTAGYSACLRISNLIDLPSGVFAEVIFPRASRIASDNVSEVKRFYESAVGATLVFSLPAIVVTILFAKTILWLLAGPEYVWADGVLRITAFFGLSLPFLKQYGTIMDATGRPIKGFILMLFAFVLNIPVNIYFLSVFGVIGAAIGTALTYFLIVLISFSHLQRQYKVSILSILSITVSHYMEFWKLTKTYFVSKK